MGKLMDFCLADNSLLAVFVPKRIGIYLAMGFLWVLLKTLIVGKNCLMIYRSILEDNELLLKELFN